MLRRMAYVFVRFAFNGQPWGQAFWLAALENQLNNIRSDFEALVWAIGCVWNVRAERFIRRSPPPLNCVLLLTGLYLAVSFLLTHLTWYGHSPTNPSAEGQRILLKLEIFIAVIFMVGTAAPGRRSRKIFAAVVFPFLALVGLLSLWSTGHMVDELAKTGVEHLIETLLRGLVLGILTGVAVSIPAILIYRTVATPIAILALMPAIAKGSSAVTQLQLDLSCRVVLNTPLWTLICCIATIVISTRVWGTWLHRSRMMSVSS